MEPMIQVIEDVSAYTVAVHGNVVFLLWKDAPRVEGVHALRKAFNIVREAVHDEKIGFFTIIHEKTAKANIPADVRQGVAAVLKENEKRLAGAAIVYEGKGFYATLIRNVIMAIHLASRATFPTGINSNVKSCSEWLASKLVIRDKRTISSEELCKIVASLDGESVQADAGQVKAMA